MKGTMRIPHAQYVRASPTMSGVADTHTRHCIAVEPGEGEKDGNLAKSFLKGLFVADYRVLWLRLVAHV